MSFLSWLACPAAGGVRGAGASLVVTPPGGSVGRITGRIKGGQR